MIFVVGDSCGTANKVVVITGAASGIGRATAHAMARLGARVAVVDINKAGAKEVAGTMACGNEEITAKTGGPVTQIILV